MLGVCCCVRAFSNRDEPGPLSSRGEPGPLSSRGELGLLSSWGAQASHCDRFSSVAYGP